MRFQQLFLFQKYLDFSEDEMAVFETKEASSVSAQLATIVQPQKE